MNYKTNTYFVEGLSAKSNKRLTRGTFRDLESAIDCAIEWQGISGICQAEIYYTKNILSDVLVASLDLKGKIIYN